MKKLNDWKQGRLILVMLLLFLCIVPSRAHRQEHEMKKEWNETFKAGPNDKLMVNNQFGNITITYGTKQEVSFHVIVEAKSGSESRIKAMMDRVKISFSKSGNLISGETTLSPANFSTKGIETFTIDYYVEVPVGFDCTLKQKYGNINLPNTNSGTIRLNSMYGNISGGNFTAPLYIDSRYGNIDLGDLNKAVFDLSYCTKAIARDVEDITIDSKYSDVELDNVSRLSFDGKYGNLRISRLTTGTISLSYSESMISELLTSLSLEQLRYSNMTIRSLSPDFTLIDASAHYGNLNINLPPDASFRVNAKNMKYAECQVKGFKSLKRLHESNSNDFSSRSEQQNKDAYFLEINNGSQRSINFDGNKYSNLKVIAK